MILDARSRGHGESLPCRRVSIRTAASVGKYIAKRALVIRGRFSLARHSTVGGSGSTMEPVLIRIPTGAARVQRLWPAMAPAAQRHLAQASGTGAPG